MRYRFLLATGLSLSVCLVATQAQPSPILKIEEQRQAAAKLKIDQALSDAIKDAENLQRSGSTQRAIERLKQAQRLLDDPILSKDFADARRNQLTLAIKNVTTGERLAPEPTTNPHKAVDAAKLKAMMEADGEIRRSMDTIAALMKGGAIEQAKKEVDALAKKYPDHPTMLVMPELVNRTKTIDDIREIHAKQVENIRLAMVDLQKGSTLPKYDYEFPANWKELSERRKTQLTPEMKAVLAGLRSPITIDVKNAPVGDLLKSISEKIKLPIQLDKATMQEVGIDISSPVTVSTGTETQARTALKKVLASFNLTYIVKGGAIHVVTPEKAAQTMETRVYYIGDLILSNTATPGVPRFSPIGNELERQAMMRNVENLIDHIKKADPNSWKGGGSDGKGEISYHAASMALIVKASAEVHGMLSGTFGK